MMSENDSGTNVDSTTVFIQEGPGDKSFNDDDDEDVHICKKCNLAFTELQQYLEHKVKHDNFKVKYCRSGVDRRMIMPKLVQRQIKKEAVEQQDVTEPEGTLKQNADQPDHKSDDQKENEHVKRGRRGKRKREVNDDLVIREKPVYACTKCDRKFNREAPLRFHMEYDHVEDPDIKEEEEEMEDGDEEYKPNKAELKEDEEETDEQLNETASKKQKMSEEDKANRRFACNVCGNRFKELPVLKGHMLTHSNRRDFVCKFEGCSYSFKTKGSLKRHSRRHTGERPFPCEMCGRAFSESGALTRHLKSRVSCVLKTDSDLPRYGTKWGNTPKMIAKTAPLMTSSSSDIQAAVVSEPAISASNLTSCTADQVVEAEESLTSLPAVVHVLESDLTESEILHAEEEIAQQDGIEQRGVEVIIQDESIGQFVQSETEIAIDQLTTCKVCKDDFLTIEALKIHLRTHLADTTFRCWLCHFVSENKEQFIDHMYSQHSVQLKGNDPLSNLVTQPADDKEETADKGQNHREAQLAVKQLLELPTDISQQETSQTSFGTRLMYKCPVCMRKFRGNNYLRLHMRNHTGLRPHKCPECEKSFITKDTLTKHMGVHTEERNFKCGECGKLFKRLSHVREHLKIHSSSRPFPCTICDKSFKTNNAMKVHLRTHTDILPYECSFCHRRFREKGSLLRHTRLHTGEKPYECKYCGRCFAEHGTLNRHLKAKVSCTEQLQEIREDGSSSETKDFPTVLAEFSSVVADTQQYIVPQEGGEENILEEIEEAQQAAEYVVVQTDAEGEQIQNVEIIADTEGGTMEIEGVQVSENYLVISDPNGDGMRILDNRTGETIAMVPVSNSIADSQPDNQTVMVTDENEIEAVAMVPVSDTDITLEHVLLQSDGSTSVEVADVQEIPEVDQQEPVNSNE